MGTYVTLMSHLCFHLGALRSTRKAKNALSLQSQHDFHGARIRIFGRKMGQKNYQSITNRLPIDYQSPIWASKSVAKRARKRPFFGSEALLHLCHTYVTFMSHLRYTYVTLVL